MLSLMCVGASFIGFRYFPGLSWMQFRGRLAVLWYVGSIPALTLGCKRYKQTYKTNKWCAGALFRCGISLSSLHVAYWHLPFCFRCTYPDVLNCMNFGYHMLRRHPRSPASLLMLSMLSMLWCFHGFDVFKALITWQCAVACLNSHGATWRCAERDDHSGISSAQLS